jgi:hypothetical protein
MISATSQVVLPLLPLLPALPLRAYGREPLDEISALERQDDLIVPVSPQLIRIFDRDSSGQQDRVPSEAPAKGRDPRRPIAARTARA